MKKLFQTSKKKLTDKIQFNRQSERNQLQEKQQLSSSTSSNSYPLSTKSNSTCQYDKYAKIILSKLNLPLSEFNQHQNQCFCLPCHNDRKGVLYYEKGHPKRKYGAPIGWYYMPIRKRCSGYLEKYTKWHRAYFATNADRLMPTLESNDIFVNCSMSMTDSFLCKLNLKEERNEIVVSPSIAYAGLDYFSAPFDVSIYGDWKKIKVVWQVLVEPESYYVRGESIGDLDCDIDGPGFKNNELEWVLNSEKSVIIQGLLVLIR